jgi:nucleoside-diphosphate-sugar epimerase
MRILLTGSDGYIGAVLLPFLRSRGHEVVGLDAGFYNDGVLYGPREIATADIRKDIRHITEEDLQGFEAVVHLAELSNDPLGQHNPELTFAINHRGSVRLAELCRQVGIPRFVYTSSCSVYGIGTGEHKTEESSPHPQTAYAQCKLLVERDVAALGNGRFSPTFLRNATAFGASPRMRFDVVLNNLAGLAWITREIRMTSDGTPWRPLVHILDISEAIACVLAAPREVIHGEIFNVGDNAQNYQVKDIAGIVARVSPGCAVTFGGTGADNRSYRVSFDKIHARLPAFRCRRDVETGAAELREVFERIGMPRDVFEFRAFTRLKQLEHLLATRQIDQQFFWR